MDYSLLYSPKKTLIATSLLVAATAANPTHAIVVAVHSNLSSGVNSNLTAAGHTVTSLSTLDIENGALTTTAFDTFIFGRAYTGTVSQQFVDNVSGFVTSGGGLVTEWDGAALLFSGYDTTYRFSTSNPQAGLLSGQIGAGDFLATDTPITLTGSHPVTSGLPGVFSGGGGTEFFYTIYGYDPGEVDVVATFQGNGTTDFPSGTFPAILVGKSLPVVVMPFDYQDNANDPNLSALYVNAVEFSATAVPEPSAFAAISGLLALTTVLTRRKQRRQ